MSTDKEAPEIISFERYLVCFVDLLGSTKAIEKDEMNFFCAVYNLFNSAKSMCETYGDKLNFSDIKMKAFSDNIIFVYKIPNELSYEECCTAVQTMSSFVSMFQFLALNDRILIRGGMSVGTLCFNDMFVWGKALIDAYKLENINAIYPRIIVDDKVFELLVDADGEIKFGIPVYQDIDGLGYLNFLYCISEGSRPWLLHHCFLIIEELKSKNENNNKVLQKIFWLESYLQKFQVDNNITEQMIEEAVEMDKKLHDDIMSGKYE